MLVSGNLKTKVLNLSQFERFITELEKLPEAVSEFDDALRVSFVEYVTVGSRCCALYRPAFA